MRLPRLFALRRDEDVTGVSGTGDVAYGVEFPSGVVALCWQSEWPTSVVFHDRGMESVEAIHGHGGRTRVVWLGQYEQVRGVYGMRDRDGTIGVFTDVMDGLNPRAVGDPFPLFAPVSENPNTGDPCDA